MRWIALVGDDVPLGFNPVFCGLGTPISNGFLTVTVVQYDLVRDSRRTEIVNDRAPVGMIDGLTATGFDVDFEGFAIFLLRRVELHSISQEMHGRDWWFLASPEPCNRFAWVH